MSQSPWARGSTHGASPLLTHPHAPAHDGTGCTRAELAGEARLRPQHGATGSHPRLSPQGCHGRQDDYKQIFLAGRSRALRQTFPPPAVPPRPFPHWLCFLTAASARGLLRAVPSESPACEMAQPWAGSQLCRRDAGQVASRRLPTLGQAHDHTSASRGKFRGDVR